MRRRETQSLGEVLRQVLKAQQLEPKLNENRVLDAWDRVLGPSIVKYTNGKYIKNRVLYVSLTSSVLKQELSYSRQQLVDSLNKEVGEEVIKDIYFQ